VTTSTQKRKGQRWILKNITNVFGGSKESGLSSKGKEREFGVGALLKKEGGPQGSKVPVNKAQRGGTRGGGGRFILGDSNVPVGERKKIGL